MLAFPGDTEKGKHVQQFVSCVGTETVGFLVWLFYVTANISFNFLEFY